MEKKLKTHSLGKLRIYLNTGEKVKSKTLLRKLFPKNTYKEVIILAKESGLMNASVFPTHFGYSNYGKINQHSIESDNSGLTICIELIDTKANLQQFFLTHKEIFKDKVVVYKEVEFWDVD